MLVPGIHSDSKIKLQEEICTRNERVSMTSEHLASLFLLEFFFPSWSGQFLSISVGFRRAAFLLALRRSSPTPLNTFAYWRRQQWTQKGEVR